MLCGWLAASRQAPGSELRTSYIVIRTFKLRFSVHVSNDAHAFTVCRCGSPINCNLKYELRDSKYEVIVRLTAVITAVTHARLCNTAPQAPDS